MITETNVTPFDAWSTAHALTGFAAGVVGVPFWPAFVVALAYEYIEHHIESGPNPFGTGRPESLANVAADVALSVVTYWLAIQLCHKELP